MIAWGTIRPALLNLIASLSGLNTVWAEQPQGYASHAIGFGPSTVATPGAVCKLSIGPAITKGWDEVRTNYDESRPLEEELEDRVQTVRVFSLKVMIEIQDQRDGQTADHYAEIIRAGMHFRSSRQALINVNCAFVSSTDIQDLSAVRDNRSVSRAAVDIRLSASGVAVDPQRYGYIDTVDLIEKA